MIKLFRRKSKWDRIMDAVTSRRPVVASARRER